MRLRSFVLGLQLGRLGSWGLGELRARRALRRSAVAVEWTGAARRCGRTVEVDVGVPRTKDRFTLVFPWLLFFLS